MTETAEVEAPAAPYVYPFLRVQVYTHTDDGGFTSRIGFDLPIQEDFPALAYIGKEINRGEDSVGVRYRSAGFPPLGVGDLIRLGTAADERWYFCEKAGWKACARPDSLPEEYVAAAGGGRRVKRQGI